MPIPSGLNLSEAVEEPRELPPGGSPGIGYEFVRISTKKEQIGRNSSPIMILFVKIRANSWLNNLVKLGQMP